MIEQNDIKELRSLLAGLEQRKNLQKSKANTSRRATNDCDIGSLDDRVTSACRRDERRDKRCAVVASDVALLGSLCASAQEYVPYCENQPKNNNNT